MFEVHDEHIMVTEVVARASGSIRAQPTGTEPISPLNREGAVVNLTASAGQMGGCVFRLLAVVFHAVSIGETSPSPGFSIRWITCGIAR
jgi:hypothetical protein